MKGATQFAHFWNLEQPQDATAAIESSTGLGKTYGDLRRDADQLISDIPGSTDKQLFLLLAQNRYECLVAYLAALRSGNALMVLDAALSPELLRGIVDVYRPALIFVTSTARQIPGYSKLALDGVGVLQAETVQRVSIHPDLALLLSTSGSTGSPKFVRLTYENLQANAASIATYLELTAEERAITSLSMSYSYGLSVINSHLLTGACLVLTDYGILRREFWDGLDTHRCTSFSGVPYTYQMLLQTGLLKKRGANLRTLTQAGGKLAEPHVCELCELVAPRNAKFVVMYGQTEATARISYLPFASLPAKAGSVGVAIPGGSLWIDSAGELIYEGGNVMMGYAQCVEDLARGDELRGILRTGDLARKDEDGFFYITGRLQRFLKLFGKRFSLDEIEQLLQNRFAAPAACFGQDDQLMVAISNDGNPPDVSSFIRQTFGLPVDVVTVTAMTTLPRTSSGKIDYRVLAKNCATRQAALKVAR